MTLAFDHVHLVSRDPREAARWYAEKFGARILKDTVVFGQPQIYLRIGEMMLIVRGARDGETVEDDTGKRWGVDHFGFRVQEGFDEFCDALRAKGARFTLDPVDINVATRAAYIEGPDGVRIELLLRREWPDLVHFGVDPASGIAKGV